MTNPASSGRVQAHGHDNDRKRRSPARRLASRLLGLSVRGLSRLSGRLPRIIFTYHKVGEAPGAVPAPVLDRQIARAREAGFQLVPLSLMVEWALGRTELPPGAVALTFDDGLADTARVAGPILRRHGVSGTVFPVLEFIGGPRRYSSSRQRRYLLEDDGEPGTTPYDYMTWEELDGWVESGGEVGGHTLSHPFLGGLDGATGLQEVIGCRQQLASRYGKQPVVFCYPYGDDSGQAGQWVQEAGFTAAVTSREGCVDRSSHRYHLPRLPAPPTADGDFDDLLFAIFKWRQRLRSGLQGS